ncbi:hypothetical protein UA08_07144 [Talaromyces atroroseus]|uniref:F-box domain-containing protein n=1 Tax=Talaromyces atroroseus TaxID=1441469 RepID=A0A225AHU7_TALAT|nr:hypothetical protein UA08_07144 [Talaromyces atroroseus]OKL57784.1 hypothetical protein UA08_07144 [Talaromyces atroroseus]
MATVRKTRHSKESLLWRLPTEILIDIMKYSPNFSCLWSLINASQRFHAIFMGAAQEIVEAVMSDVPACIQALMRLVVTARTAPGSYTDIKDVIKHMSRQKPYQPWQTQDPQFMHSFVGLAHTTHSVAHACLDYYVERSLAMKPQCLNSSHLETLFTPQSLLYSKQQSQGQPYRPKKTGPATYVEEQRVLRLLWRLQTIFTLRFVASELTHWPEEDRTRLLTTDMYSMLYLFHNSSSRCIWSPVWESEQYLTVIEYLNQVNLMTSSQTLTENSLANFLLQPFPGMEHKAYHSHCFPPPPPPSQKVPPGLERYVDINYEIEEIPVGYDFYKTVTTDAKKSPLQNVPFAPYRRYGFAIWDVNRLTDMGFLVSQDGMYGLMEQYKLYFTWRSILTPEEDAQGVVILPRFTEQKMGLLSAPEFKYLLR